MNQHSEKIMSKQKVISVSDENGYPVMTLAYKGPRASEQVWKPTKGSISSIGAKANTLANHGIIKRKHG
jgi:hypothetical protein